MLSGTLLWSHADKCFTLSLRQHYYRQYVLSAKTANTYCINISFDCAVLSICTVSLLWYLFFSLEQTLGPLPDRKPVAPLLAVTARGSVISSASGLLLLPCKRQTWSNRLEHLTQIRLYIRPCMMEILLREQIIRLLKYKVFSCIGTAWCVAELRLDYRQKGTTERWEGER